jgi:hypothetical protein
MSAPHELEIKMSNGLASIQVNDKNRFYVALFPVLCNAMSNPADLKRLIANPTETLKANNVEIGAAQISCNWVESTNTLCVHVTKSSTKWHGSIQLSLDP